jgi:hypothetical protein
MMVFDFRMIVVRRIDAGSPRATRRMIAAWSRMRDAVSVLANGKG